MDEAESSEKARQMPTDAAELTRSAPEKEPHDDREGEGGRGRKRKKKQARGRREGREWW